MYKTEVFFLLFNFVSTVALTFINKACFSRISFGYPAVLSNFHFFVTWIGVDILRRAGKFKPLHKPYSTLSDRNFLTIVVVVGLVTPLNNTSLKLNSIGFYQIFKLLVTPGIVFLEYILNGKVLSRSCILSLIAVCIFVLLSSGADIDFNVRGTIFATVWVPLACIYKVQWGRLIKIHNCSTLSLMHLVLPYAMVIQTAIIPLVDPPGILNYNWTVDAYIWIGLSSVCAFFVNYSGFLVMARLGAIPHVLLGQFKTCIIMVGSTLIFGSTFSIWQIFSSVGAIMSIIAYSFFASLEKDKDGKDSTPKAIPTHSLMKDREVVHITSV